MQSESEDLASFQEMVNVRLFFSGAQRRKTVEETKKAIVNAVPVITITGDEGSGKTMICRMVEKELPLDYSCAYLADTPESFDDVVQILARVLGTENSQDIGSSQDLVVEIVKYLEDNDHRLVAIFDQSERMYLAILERIRKMLDQINSKEVLFHVILAGRKTLLENLKQLAICNFKSVEEKSFSLNPLELSETYAYLNSSVHQRSSSGKNIFTPEAAKKIYTLAKGNFRLTNMLAEKSLESSDSGTSFMVLLENVQDGGSAGAKPKDKGKLVQLVFVRNKWLTGALVLLVVVAGFLLFSGDDTKDDSLVTVKNKKAEETAVALKKETTAIRETPPVKIASAPKTLGKETGELADGSEKIIDPLKSENESGRSVRTLVSESVSETSPMVKEEPSPAKVESVGTSQQNDEQAVGDTVKTTGRIDNEDIADETKELVSVEEVTVIEKETVLLKAQMIAETENSAVAENTTAEKAPETKVVVEAIEVVPATIENEEAIFEEVEKGATIPVVVEEKTEMAEKPSDVAMAEEQEIDPIEAPDIVPSEVEGKLIGSEKSEATDTQLSTVSGEVQNHKRIIEVSADESEELLFQTVPEEELITISEIRKRKPSLQETETATATKKIVKIAPATVNFLEHDVKTDGKNQEDIKALERLYKQRVAAASMWVSGNSNDKHTVQLMVLTSEQAEGNLKKRFEQDEYREIAEDLYVIKNTNDSSVFVYYGEYADPDSARKARNTLPIFLRKHNPYVISVENAVKKATSP